MPAYPDTAYADICRLRSGIRYISRPGITPSTDCGGPCRCENVTPPEPQTVSVDEYLARRHYYLRPREYWWEVDEHTLHWCEGVTVNGDPGDCVHHCGWGGEGAVCELSDGVDGNGHECPGPSCPHYRGECACFTHGGFTWIDRGGYYWMEQDDFAGRIRPVPMEAGYDARQYAWWATLDYQRFRYGLDSCPEDAAEAFRLAARNGMN